MTWIRRVSIRQPLGIVPYLPKANWISSIAFSLQHATWRKCSAAISGARLSNAKRERLAAVIGASAGMPPDIQLTCSGPASPEVIRNCVAELCEGAVRVTLDWSTRFTGAAVVYLRVLRGCSSRRRRLRRPNAVRPDHGIRPASRSDAGRCNSGLDIDLMIDAAPSDAPTSEDVRVHWARP